MNNRILKINQKIETFGHALVAYLPWLIKLRRFFFNFTANSISCWGKNVSNSPGVSSPRYFWTSDVISTLFLWKKELSDVIISKDYLVRESLSGISGYHSGHRDYFDKFQVIWRMNWSFIDTLISMY